MTFSTNTDDLLSAAQWHVDRGDRIIPIRRGGKLPVLRGGYLSATDDMVKIKQWISAGLNLAAYLSIQNICLDVDVKAGAYGDVTLAGWSEQLCPLPATRTCRSPSGGTHLHFTLPPALTAAERPAGCNNGDTHIDVRSGSQFYLLIPGSYVEGVGLYTVEQDVAPAELPSLWCHHLVELNGARTAAMLGGKTSPEALKRARARVAKRQAVWAEMHEFGVSPLELMLDTVDIGQALVDSGHYEYVSDERLRSVTSTSGVAGVEILTDLNGTQRVINYHGSGPLAMAARKDGGHTLLDVVDVYRYAVLSTEFGDTFIPAEYTEVTEWALDNLPDPEIPEMMLRAGNDLRTKVRSATLRDAGWFIAQAAEVKAGAETNTLLMEWARYQNAGVFTEIESDPFLKALGKNSGASIATLRKALASAAKNVVAKDNEAVKTRFNEGGSWEGGKYTYNNTPHGLMCMFDAANGEPSIVRLGPPLMVDCETFDTKGASNSLVLSWVDNQNKQRHLAIPASMFAGDGSRLESALRDCGYVMEQSAVGRIVGYLIAVQKSGKLPFKVNTPSLGWFNGHFVTPAKVYGGDGVVYQSLGWQANCMTQAGELQTWRSLVAAAAMDSPALTLFLSTAFLGPLMEMIGMGTFGIHIYGSSSTGKSICLAAAASVWGPSMSARPTGNNINYFDRPWQGTDNGMEMQAVSRNHVGLYLDEIAAFKDPRNFGVLIYKLMSGMSKARAQADNSGVTSGAPTAEWAMPVLSTGEIAAADFLRSSGERVQAGQEHRMVDLSADAGRGYGIFTDPGWTGSSKDYAEAVRNAIAENYGVAGAVWLSWLTGEALPEGINALDVPTPSELRERIKRTRLRLEAKAANNGLLQRVAERFAAIAVAGEMATELGLTGWFPGHATDRVVDCYQMVIERLGMEDGRTREAVTTQEMFLSFIAANGGRFHDPDSKVIPRDRVGKYTCRPLGQYLDAAKTQELCSFRYSIFRENLSLMVGGRDERTAAQELFAAGLLQPGNGGALYKQERCESIGLGRKYCYVYEFTGVRYDDLAPACTGFDGIDAE